MSEIQLRTGCRRGRGREKGGKVEYRRPEGMELWLPRATRIPTAMRAAIFLLQYTNLPKYDKIDRRWELINLIFKDSDQFRSLSSAARLKNLRMVGAHTSSTERSRPVGTPKMETAGTLAVESHTSGIGGGRGERTKLLFGVE